MGRWEGIEEYICVVEAGSFTAAADRLGVSKSYVSKQVSQLEDRLRVRLLQRTTRRLTLTEIGEVFYGHCKAMAEQFDQAESTLSDLQLAPRGTLKLSINSRYGVQYMASVVAAFSREYPDLSVEVHSSFKDVDLLEEGFDLTVRYGKLEDSSLIARKLGSYSLCLCAAPGYWQSRGKPACPEDLKQHNCLTTSDRFWLFNTPDGRDTLKVKVGGNWLSEDGATLLAAAKAGIGVAQLPDFYVQEAVDRGELVKLQHQDWSHYERETWAVYPHSRHLSAKVRYFIEFLTLYIGRNLSPHSEKFLERPRAR
ncbi:LysR family transcriptional regulator [Parahaliea mediterranea]|uniref:LysR family transcriptional regulator n=1 Tax=Parahaliea mediterranea TaxID=651086 RepID=A0A939DGI5_9GAMM|nr:LysR family transcriptional regulator [Parahaliea mediterranea]MBN7797082.1 LysR family transcriptional regulator [Parahaliea mediterranea]